MQCYTELTPPTAVTHSLAVPFVSADSQNLIVAKTSLLQIYKTKASGKDTKLVLLAEYTLSGTVTSLVRVKTQATRSGGEALLVGFKDAKLSLVEWDPARPGISTISIHYYEQDELQGAPWTPLLSNCINYLTVDPSSRCAALKFGTRNLAILPFRQGDEDLAMEDDDWDELDGPRPEKVVSKVTNGNDDGTPYGSSFVMRLSSLHPNLMHPVHLAFLHEYREPTFGILSSVIIPSSALLAERRDHLTYMVFTLDLHQRASTTILSVTGLPYDLFKIIALPTPIGGALLVGGNELVHVDQSGKATGVAVNSFARQCTAFGLADQSELNLRLEGSSIEQLSLGSGEMLIVLHTGAIAILSFHVDGRSVSGLSVRKVSPEAGGHVITSAPSSSSLVGPNTIFLGSESGDSVLLGWNRKSTTVSRRKSRIVLEDLDESLLDDEDEDDDDDLDDDLYGESTAVVQSTTNGRAEADTSNSKAGDYVFKIHDSLVSIAPIGDITLGKRNLFALDEYSNSEGVRSDLELVTSTGKDRASALAIIHQNIQPKVIGRFDFPDARGIWTLRVKKSIGKGQPDDQAGSKRSERNSQYDSIMIVSKATEGGAEESDVYLLTPTGFDALTDTEFEHMAGSTIEAGMMGKGTRVIQVLKSEVRSYDGELGLAQIMPMDEEETGLEPKIISASIADPFLLLVRDDSSINVIMCEDNNELEEQDRVDDALLATKWLTGCLYTDTHGVFGDNSDKGQSLGDGVLLFLLSASGALHIYALPDLSKAVYVAEGLCFVPPVLSADYVARKSAARETLTEIIVADLGDSVSKFPYLILRASNDDLTIYEPFRVDDATEPNSLRSTLRFVKIHNPHLAKDPEISAQEEPDEEIQQTRDGPMRAISNLGGYSAVFLSGGSPSFVLKSSKSTPKVMSLQGAGVRNLSGFHTSGCERGFIYTDVNGTARVAQLPANTSYDIGMALRKMELGQAVHGVTYHPPSEAYVVGTSVPTDFELPKDDDQRRDWQREEIAFKPTVEQSFVKLINPVSWSVIDTFELDPCEMIMCIETLDLEVSEHTHERRQLITVGTALSKGEDLAIKGRVYVFDVISVIPQAGKPETDKRFKLIAKEEIPRGAVTAVSEVGTQGFMIVAQGQKCMIRGLKEDGSLLPVAFMDMNCYVTALKSIPGTGLCVMGDTIKGAWLAGYTEEPYRMILFGKSATNLEVVAADLLPDGEDLFIVVADAECNLHVMQYDPEHPKSLQGHLFLHRTTFSLGGHMPTTLTRLPRTLPATTLPPLPTAEDAANKAADATVPASSLLLTTLTGALGILSPLTEPQYRKLNTLASTLATTLYHACGLNPRAYRTAIDAPESMVGGRNVVDGSMVLRFMELGSQRRTEVAGRVGVDVLEVREELAGLMGGLGYL